MKFKLKGLDFKKYSKDSIESANKEIIKSAYVIFNESQNLVPKDTRTKEMSGIVSIELG